MSKMSYIEINAKLILHSKWIPLNIQQSAKQPIQSNMVPILQIF